MRCKRRVPLPLEQFADEPDAPQDDLLLVLIELNVLDGGDGLFRHDGEHLFVELAERWLVSFPANNDGPDVLISHQRKPDQMFLENRVSSGHLSLFFRKL